ncbi:MAG TPA: sulfotransferase [Terriglobales bacterium]|nr:sulfotransferase [Terriglobales bacterium]
MASNVQPPHGKVSHSDVLPSFFVLGPPRTGTTWLYEVLRQKTSLPFPTKETRYFDLHFHRGLSWYLAHFPECSEPRIRGEVAPTYFASAEAREHIAKLVPSAKVVCVFRNPVDRVLSLYRLKRAYGMSPWSFEQAVIKDPELVESGRYATHLKAWQNTLGRDQVLVTVYEDLRRDPQTYLNTISDFIGIPRIELSLSEMRRTHESEGLTHPRSYFLTKMAYGVSEWFKAERMDGLLAAAKKKVLLKLLLRSGSKFEALPPDLACRLYELFRPEVEELESILNRDFPAWKFCESKTGELQAAA